MKKIILSSITAVSLIISSSVAKDIYATIDGVNITKADINIAIQDPRVDFDTLPEKAQKNVLDQIINKKLLSKHAFSNGIEKDKDYQESLSKLKDDLAFQVWQRNELRDTKITDSEINKFFNENKEKFKQPQMLEARHILVKTEDEAKALIKQLNSSKELEKDFIELAKTKSTGPSGKSGGYLGKFQAAQMVPEFSAAAASLKKATITQAPVKTQFGFHVIYLIDNIAAKTMTFNEVKGNISKMLSTQKYNENVKKLADDLRSKANIVIK
ncbi:MAG: Putative peptidyl-prolyl cis-trans isomerase [Arcobacter lacus]|nr:MAG: Putative peptidyl-prolyl cis-trans isomerase [Arcobacter lacus]